MVGIKKELWEVKLTDYYHEADSEVNKGPLMKKNIKKRE
jgi:hypothetical protein